MESKRTRSNEATSPNNDMQGVMSNEAPFNETYDAVIELETAPSPFSFTSCLMGKRRQSDPASYCQTIHRSHTHEASSQNLDSHGVSLLEYVALPLN